MDFTSFKAAIIKKARSVTNLEGGRIVIYQNMTFMYPDGKSTLMRNILTSEYINSKLENKKPYFLFFVPITIPVAFIQNGFFIARKVQCMFGFYDGKDMREDVHNTLKLVSQYRRTVLLTAATFIFIGVILTIIGNLWMFLGIVIIAWFALVLLFSLMLSISDLEDDMLAAVDLDRINFDDPKNN